MSRSRVRPLGDSAALLLGDCSSVAGEVDGTSHPPIDLFGSGVGAGVSHVIVELRIPPAFTLEGDLRNTAAVEAQRRAIAKVQVGPSRPPWMNDVLGFSLV